MHLETIELPSVRIEKRAVRRIDFWLLGAVLLLEMLSLPLIDSATHASGGHYYVKKQAVLVMASFAMLGLGTFIDYRDMVRLSPWLYAGNLVLLVAVFFVGKSVMGSTRWISLGFFDLQPSEIAKLVIILFLARHACTKEEPPETWWDIFSFYGWTLIPGALILKQPDLGTTLVLFAISTGMVYFAGAPGKKLVALAVACLLTATVLLLLHLYAGFPLPLEDYQVDRITSLFNAHKDPLGTGYQVLQSKIAIGSGTLWGKGLGKGTQNRLDFIPEQHTDFIFSVVGEELGFVKTLAVLGLYALLLYRLLLAAISAPDMAGTLVAGGVLSMLLFQVLVNMGMTMGIMPVTGVPLPFLSYGGSALVVNSFSIGLVLNISWKRHKILF